MKKKVRKLPRSDHGIVAIAVIDKGFDLFEEAGDAVDAAHTAFSDFAPDAVTCASHATLLFVADDAVERCEAAEKALQKAAAAYGSAAIAVKAYMKAYFEAVGPA